MKKLSFPLMGWLNDIEDIRYDLASSSVKAISLSELGKLDEDISLGYPPDGLEEDLEKKIADIYDVDVRSMLTPGAQAANSLIFDTYLDHGDEVLVEDPAYMPLQTVPRLKNAKVKTFKRRYEDGFKIDLDVIKESCSSNTKMIVLTNPHNPSGVFQKPDDMKHLGRYADENGIILLIDEIYRDFLHDSKSCVSISNNVLVTSSLSKSYGLGGLRLGWAVSKDEDLIKDLNKVKDHQSPKTPTPSLKIGLLAIEERDRLLKRARDIAEKGRSLARGWINGTSSLEWIEPSPGIISFPRLTADIGSEEFAKSAKDAGVLVAPGSYFSQGDEFDSHIRLTFGKDFRPTAQGFKQLSKVVQSMKDRT